VTVLLGARRLGLVLVLTGLHSGCTARLSDLDDRGKYEGDESGDTDSASGDTSSGAIDVAGLAERVEADGLAFVHIPAHAFDMGCTPGQTGCDPSESPVMPVTLTYDYYIGETEITQGQFGDVMGYNPSYFSACGSNCPVETVSWHQAAAFANEVSTAAGLPGCYTCAGSGSSVTCSVAIAPKLCAGYRLPTEAEWEAAARCGDDLLHAGSEELDPVAWYASNSGAAPRPTATKAPNACGLFDMSGNVYEWIQDRFDGTYYTSSGRVDPEGPTTGSFPVIRGGAWSSDAQFARVAVRFWSLPTDAGSVLGFRLVRTAP